MNEGLSKKLLILKFLRRLNKEYDGFSTLVKFSKEEKRMEDIKQDLNFEIENVKKMSVYSTIKNETALIVKKFQDG